MDGHVNEPLNRMPGSHGHVNEPLNHTPEIQVLKCNRTLPEEFTWPSKSKTRKKFICILWCRGPPLIDYSNMGHGPGFISGMSFTTYFYVYHAGELHLYHEIRKNTLLRASPETTWFDKKKNPNKVRQEPRQAQKEPGLIKKEPRQGAARTKTRSERIRIEEKQPR